MVPKATPPLPVLLFAAGPRASLELLLVTSEVCFTV